MVDDITTSAAVDHRVPAQPTIHPSRLALTNSKANIITKPPGKKKLKTDAKKRYLKKKLDKRKKRLKAVKASTPKSRTGTGQDAVMHDQSGSESDDQDSDSSDEEAEPIPSGLSVKHMPSADTAIIPALPIPVASTSTLPPISDEANPPRPGPSAEEAVEESVEQRRLRRNAEKKAKREERRRQEAVQAEQTAKKKARKRDDTVPVSDRLADTDKRRKRDEAVSPMPADGTEPSLPIKKAKLSLLTSRGDEEGIVDPTRRAVIIEEQLSEVSSSGGESEAEDGSAEADVGLVPFPLPSSTLPAASTLTLAKQGLPEGMRDAVLVEESIRTKIDELRMPQAWSKSEAGQLGGRMLATLRGLGIDDFFAVQTALIPELMTLPLTPNQQQISGCHDFLVSAPTGSGKTLAYGIPVIETLSTRVVTRLRALVILPTRDLVMQVRETLQELAKGSGLRIGTATGQHAFAQEQVALVGNTTDRLLGGSSKVDILIATPGRLMDHLRGTQNFTLQHLRFLVIDEADRLLAQTFHDWLKQVLAHLDPPSSTGNGIQEGNSSHDALAAGWYDEYTSSSAEWEGKRPLSHPCQKLLFSATLTRDPGKIAALELRNPKYFIVGAAQTDPIASAANATGQHFAVPAALTERMLVVSSDVKPLHLLHLLHDQKFGITSALCFTKSVDSTERLLRLIDYFDAAYTASARKLVVRSYSGELETPTRRKLLADFAKGSINLLVCSDLIARGIDLPMVEHVISYDAPVDMRKYTHRVGRTARAGRAGTAWTLVEAQEARHFKQMMSAADRLARIKRIRVAEDDLALLRDSYGIALGRLRDAYSKSR